MKLVHLNITYASSIIGEIQIKYGKKPIHYHSNHFLYELARADSL